MESIPTFSKDLIEQLDKEMPRPLYATSQDFEEFLIRTGERRLIETLLIKLQRTLKRTEEEEG